ncbi:MAG: pyridoxal phosphate-dependent aminotransferase [Pseudomonadota bacterium]
MHLANRTEWMKPSATVNTSTRAKEMKAKGIDIINLSAGEPDFDTPDYIKQKAIEALNLGHTKYTPPSGIADLKMAVSEKFKNDNNLSFALDEICITCGAKLGIYNALQILVDPGDEVIIPSPYWVSYPTQVELAGGKPVILPLEDDLLIDIEKLKKAVTKRTRAIIICSPSNPSGMIYSRELLEAIASICIKNNIFVISDEIYEKLTYDGVKHISIANVNPDIKNLSLIANGFSKSYAMTGWRVGYMAAPKEFIQKMTSLQAQQLTGLPSFIQEACVTALTKGNGDIERMRSEFEKRRNLIFDLVSSIPHVKVHKPQGAFYLLPDMREIIELSGSRSIKSSNYLTEHILTTAHVALVSGEPFGAPGYIRISYASSEEDIKEAVQRLTVALNHLK